MDALFAEIRACRLCEPHLPLGARPIVRGKTSAKILIIGQAPGTKVHASGVPWDDASGRRLRQWMQLDEAQFYDERRIAIVPMGLCYPGKGRSGDLPPRAECAPLWHPKIWSELKQLELVLLIGQYAQRYYLPTHYKTLTETVQNATACPTPFFPLPHPSPRNQLWLKRNPWFSSDTLPLLQHRIDKVLN